MTCPLCGEPNDFESHLGKCHRNPRSGKIEVRRDEPNGFRYREVGYGMVERMNDGKRFSNVWIRAQDQEAGTLQPL